MASNKKRISVFVLLPVILLFLGNSLSAQTTKYWVKFKNKNGTPYSVSTPTAFLTVKSVQRRTAYGIAVDQTDLPVTPAYITQVDNVSGVTVLYASKWMNGVVISTSNSSALTTINSFTFVQSTGAVNRLKVNIEKIEEPVSTSENFNRTNNIAAFNYGGSYWQSKQLGVDCIHNSGFRGQGMTVAVLDAGFNNVDNNPVFDSLRNRSGILGTRDFVVGGTSVYEDDSHGALVLSCMAAIKPNVIMGSAPRANYWLLRTEDVGSETPSEEYNWIRGAEFADSVGADVLTTSLGYTEFDNTSQSHTFADLNGKTSLMSIAATMAARKGMLVLNAAGNGGGSSWPKIGIPADADSICTVGAIDSLGAIAFFSSVGPTADGRIKPDLVSRGLGSWVSFPSGSCGQSNGTSFATPILAGAMTCFWQAHKTWNSIKILDTLKSTASKNSNPDNTFGWGLPNMCAVPVGVKEIKGSGFSFEVYPNPTSGEFKIEFETSITESTNLLVINNLGQIVLRDVIPPGSIRKDVDIQTLSAGVYFIKISSGSGYTIKKIVKQ